MKVPDLMVGKQLFVGTYTPNIQGPISIGIGPAAIRGASYFAGPAVFGNARTFIAPEATMMVARCENPDVLPFPPPPSILKVSSRFTLPTPIDVVLGDLEGPVGIMQHSTVHSIINDTLMSIVSPIISITANEIHIGSKAETGPEIKVSTRAEVGARVNAGVEVVNAVSVDNGVKNVNALLAAPVARIPVVFGKCTGNKTFDISHATQPGKRIRHIVAEGPEAGIYMRGKLDGSHIIELPEYWKGLVDYDTITVNLTPYGRSDTSLHVKEILEDKIIVSSDHLVQAKCFYHVYAERKDVEKNIPEYEGESPKDYPGDINQSSIAGYHYDVREG